MSANSPHDSLESTSKSLLSGLRVGDPVAWARVATIYGPLFLFWCKQLRLSDEDANDICQNVLMSVIRYGSGFSKRKDGDRFRGWLYTVTRNEVIRQQTDSQRIDPLEPEVLSSLLESSNQDSMPDDPPEVLSDLQRRALQVVQESCRPETWEIFMAAIADESDFGMIAERFQTSRENVRQIKFRLLARLRDLLELTDDSDDV